MKKITIAVILLISIPTFAQKTKIEKGVYVTKDGGEIISVVVEADNTFHVSLLSGEIETINDSLVNLKCDYKSNFKVSFLYSTIENQEEINVIYQKEEIYEAIVHLGTQNANEDPVFNRIDEIGGNTIAKSNDGSGNEIFKIKRTEFLNLALEEYNSKTQISKFKIPKEASAILISYVPNKYSTFDLKGLYNPKNKSLVVSDKGKNPKTFYLADNNVASKNSLAQAVNVEFKDNWTYAGKKEAAFEANVSNDTLVEYAQLAAVDVEVNAVKRVPFRHVRSNSFKSAVKNIAKNPKKFLVVSFDLKNKNAKSEFKSYLLTSENTVYDNIDSDHDDGDPRFEYYLATNLDEKLLLQNKLKSDKEILVYNSTGDLVYHTTGSLNDKSSVFIDYNNSGYSELAVANDVLGFEKVMLDKKATNDQLLKVLAKKQQFQSQENIPKDSTYNQEELEMYSDHKIKDRNNLYSFSVTYKIVLEKWEKIVSDFKKSNKYDEDFLAVASQELNSEGFSKNIFNQEGYTSKPIDFELLDYIFTNFSIIEEHEKSKALKDSKNPYDAVYTLNISAVLENYFREAASAVYDLNQKSMEEKMRVYYKKYVTLSGFSSVPTQNYLQNLEKEFEVVENQKEYFSTYQQYFDTMVNGNTSLIEKLDKYFTANKASIYNWLEFKMDFSNYANNAAWNVVQKSSDKDQIREAIKWSETSLQIGSENHYYYDTLARLYYKNGQREKAVSMQEKAVIFGKGTEYIEEYKAVFEKMKNGTF